MMDWSFIAFIAFATIALVGSLFVILHKNPVSSAFALILTLFAFAGIYAVLGAHFVAALQILVYTGAIMVLFVFVIMLLNSEENESDLKRSSLFFKLFTLMGVVALGALLIRSFNDLEMIQPKGALSDAKIIELGGNVQVLSEALFKDYVFHFEIISFLILGAIVATVSLHKRTQKMTNQKGVTS